MEREYHVLDQTGVMQNLLEENILNVLFLGFSSGILGRGGVTDDHPSIFYRVRIQRI